MTAKSLHWFQHVPFESLGSIETWARARGMSIESTRFHAGETPPDRDRLARIDWLVVMGGPMGVHDEAQYPWLSQEKRAIEEALALGKTIVGICLGAQLLASVLGAKVHRNAFREIGWHKVAATPGARSTAAGAALPQRFAAFHWHGDTFEIPAGAVHLARSEACENQAFIYESRALALQFHLETTRPLAEGLVRACGHELTGSPWESSAEEILAPSAEEKFTKIRGLLGAVLDGLARGNPVPRDP